MQITPTGVLYLGSFHGISPDVKAILYPDKLGDSCGFIFDYLKIRLSNVLLFNTTCDPPNLPYYGLGKWEGSPCDTIKSITEPPVVTASDQILIPNAFSPDGNGLNDNWHILNIPALQLAGITLQTVAVYNRRGNEVFKSSNINFVWNGKDWASDSYYYFIRYSTKEGMSKVQKGSVNVVR